MEQLDQLFSLQDDSLPPAGAGLAQPKSLEAQVQADSSRSGGRDLVSGTLTRSEAAVLLGVGRVETVAVQDSGMERVDQLLVRQNLAEYLDVSGKSEPSLRDSESLASYAMTQRRSR